MKIDKKHINVFLALWIKSDPELWGELRDIEIKVLLQRIVKEYSYKRLSLVHNVEESTIKKVFSNMLRKIELSLGKEVADHLKKLDRMIELGEGSHEDFTIQRVFLN